MGIFILSIDYKLVSAKLVIGIILSVSDDDVIEEVDAHQFTGPFDASCQFVIGLAG